MGSRIVLSWLREQARGLVLDALGIGEDIRSWRRAHAEIEELRQLRDDIDEAIHPKTGDVHTWENIWRKPLKECVRCGKPCEVFSAWFVKGKAHCIDCVNAMAQGTSS